VSVLAQDPGKAIGALPCGRVLGQCRLLVEDPDLASAVPEPLRERAVHECVAPVVTIPRGRVSRPPALSDAGGIGLVVLEGLLLRRVGIEGRFGAELLGEGDLLGSQRPERPLGSLSHTTGWRVLETTRLAVLDVRAAHRLARYPSLTGALVGRALERSRNFAVVMAIVHQPKVELRLHMLLWHLAGRWGRVSPQGVRLPLRLTHAVLADLIAARRPTVTGAIAKLCEHDLLHHDQGGWLLRGDPPGELLAVRSAHRTQAGLGESRPGV
jgi:CRP/FNR family cyclic AMP-dependent transcriptional regulator